MPHRRGVPGGGGVRQRVDAWGVNIGGVARTKFDFLANFQRVMQHRITPRHFKKQGVIFM